MFKKNCPKCNNKTQKNFEYCPHCGHDFNSNFHEEDYGILGKTDIIKEDMFEKSMNSPFIEKMFNQTLKMFEKQMRKMQEDSNQNKNQDQFQSNTPIKHNIQFFINGEKISQENSQIRKRNIQPKKIKQNVMPKEKLDRLAKLPKKEPSSKVRRIGAKIIYEINVPGVNDINDILINRLENSIEIKALSKDKVYSKTLNVNLPIIRYRLDNGNLFLELQGS